eukprot:scaffold79385_cov27-Tisochrysis_lutea.AAC.1
MLPKHATHHTATNREGKGAGARPPADHRELISTLTDGTLSCDAWLVEKASWSVSRTRMRAA